jgi:hypothetical protein
MKTVDPVEFVVWRVNAFASCRTDIENWGAGGLAVLEGRPLVKDDAELSSGKSVAEEAEVRDGVDGLDATWACVGRNPSATMARSYSSSPLSTDTLTGTLLDLLRSGLPALLSSGSMVGGRALLDRNSRTCPERWLSAAADSSMAGEGSLRSHRRPSSPTAR